MHKSKYKCLKSAFINYNYNISGIFIILQISDMYVPFS